MSTKTTAAVIAGVLALGAIGGTAYALNQPQPTETPAAVSTETPAPENTVEPTPSVEPTPEVTEPVATPTPEPTTSANTLTEQQSELVQVTQSGALAVLNLDAEQILTLGAEVCEGYAAGETEFWVDVPGASQEQEHQFRANAKAHLCPTP